MSTLPVHRLAAKSHLYRAGVPDNTPDLRALVEGLAQDLANGLLLVARRNPDGSVDFLTGPHSQP